MDTERIHGGSCFAATEEIHGDGKTRERGKDDTQKMKRKRGIENTGKVESKKNGEERAAAIVLRDRAPLLLTNANVPNRRPIVR
jgi:hypothetical protein